MALGGEDIGDPRDEIARLPHNLEAEQALLGAVLFDNDAFHRLSGSLRPSHFYEPFHQRLFDAIADTIRGGRLAEPALLAEEFRRDPAFKELGGLRYLADLVDRAPPAVNAPDYERAVLELARRRELVRLGAEISAAAQKGQDVSGEQIDSAALLSRLESAALQVQVETRPADLVSLNDALSGVMSYVGDRSSPVGCKTGLPPLDLQLGPMLPGDLILMAGRPSMGKSAVGVAVGFNVAAPGLADELNGVEHDLRAPAGVIQVHGEMGWADRAPDGGNRGGQVVRRLIADMGYHMFGRDFPTYKAMRDKNVSAPQYDMMRQAAEQLRGLPMVGIKRTGLRLSMLRSLVRRQVAEWDRQGIPLGLLLVDHVGLLRADNPRLGRYEAQTEIAIGMKELADEIGAPIMALVQLSRDVERRDDKRPMLADLRDSGAWEENADAVIMAYRDAYYAQREKEPETGGSAASDLKWEEWDRRRKSKTIELIMPKVREGDAGGSAMVWGELAWNAIRGSEPDRHGGSML